MADPPRFSVLVPAYNAEDTLAETIGSVRAQTFQDWELVVVDDGSTDGTRTLADSFAAGDSRIKVISQENRGSGGAYNRAAIESSAELLVTLSADDLLLPEHLAEFDRFVTQHPEADIFSSAGYYLYDDGSREPSTLHERWADPSACRMPDLLQACFFNMGAVFRREVFDAVGGFAEDMYAEDYVFFLLAFAKGFEHRFLDKPLAVHRRSSAQKSADVVRVRRADVLAIEKVLATGSLSAEESRVAHRVMRRHKSNIALRRALAALLGPSLSGRVVDRLRGRRSA